jgi:fucose 4-O-acetylase-like acetyltransferase
LWFLPCLFITKFFFAVLTKKVIKTELLLLFLFASALIGSLLYLTIPWIKLPLGLESALTGLPFFGAGYILMKHKKLLTNLRRYRIPLAIFALFGTWVIATANYHISGSQVDMRVNQLGNVPLFYIGAFGGIAGWTIISQIISKNAFLEYVGKHSLVIFAWHNILFKDLETIINSTLTQDILTSIHPIMATVYVLMAITIILFSRFILIKLKSAYRFVPFQIKLT